MDKDLKELQNFANNLNQKPEDRPYTSRSSFFAKDVMFENGTKEIKSKMQALTAVSMVISGRSSKKD